MKILQIQNKSICGNETTIDETLHDIIFKCCNSFPANSLNARRLDFRILTLFGSTYNCEKKFLYNDLKLKANRSRLTDASLKAELLLKCMKYTANLSKLAEKIQVQMNVNCEH